MLGNNISTTTKYYIHQKYQRVYYIKRISKIYEDHINSKKYIKGNYIFTICKILYTWKIIIMPCCVDIVLDF